MSLAAVKDAFFGNGRPIAFHYLAISAGLNLVWEIA